MIKERVLQIVELKGISKEKFFREIGITSANFRGNASKTPLNSNTIENIFTYFPDISLEWLITGKGEMLKQSEQNNSDLKIVEMEINYKDKYIAALEELNELRKKLDEKNTSVRRDMHQVQV